MGLTVVAALLGNSVPFGAALTAVYGGVGATVLRLGATLLVSAGVSRALAPKQPGQQAVKRDLRFAASRPPYRFVYGNDTASGSEIPYPVVGDVAYACFLINSRPSVGPFRLYLDNREVTLTGDPFTMTGPGAAASNAPFAGHLTVWIGRGDQTQVPQVFLDEAGAGAGHYLGWKPTDAGKGLTLVFLRMVAGDPAQINERWPSAIPKVDLRGPMSRVYDPRDAGQVETDPATWGFSANHALCVRDVLTQNPVRPYTAGFLVADQWIAAANVADEAVTLKAGGTEPRYAVAGAVTFTGSELEQIMAPIMSAGAARFTRVGGRLGIVPGTMRNSAMTVRDSFTGLGYSTLADDADLPTEMRVSYAPAARNGEAAELPPWPIPGAQEADGGAPKVESLDLSLIESDGQAQRVRNILGRLARRQKTLQLTAPADGVQLIAGSVVTVDLPEPYGTTMNGVYEVVSAHPALDVLGEQGLAMRVPLVLRDAGASDFAWDEQTDEATIDHPIYDGSRSGVEPPGAILALTGPEYDLDIGGAVVSRIYFEFAPSTAPQITHYDWQARVSDAANGANDNWTLNGVVDKDIRTPGGKVYGYVAGVDIFEEYDLRVRTVTDSGASAWVQLNNIQFGFSLSDVSAVAAAGRVEITATTPANSNLAGVVIYRGPDNDFDNAKAVSDLIIVPGGQVVNVSAGDADAVNVIQNGGFDDGSVWIVPSDWTIGGGVATKVAGTQDQFLEQPVSVVPGAVYRTTHTIVTRTGGQGNYRIAGDTEANGPNTFVPDVYSGTLTAPAGTGTTAGFFGRNGFAGSIDDIWLVKDTPECLAQGPGFFWIAPIAQSGGQGPEAGPYQLIIP